MDTISASNPKDAREISCSVPTVKRSQVTSSKSVSGVMRTSKNSEASTAGKAAVRKTEGTAMPDSNLSRFLRPTLSSSASSQRRNSTGNFRDKQAVATAKQTSTDGKIVSPSISDSGKKASLGSRKALLPSVSSKDLTPDASMKGKRSPAFSVLPQTSDSGKADSMRKSSSRSLESSRRVLSSSLESSSGISSIKKATSNGFSLPERTSFSASANRVSSVASSKKNSSAAESRDSRFIMLPQVDFKARDDLRLDLRGHKIRSLDAPGLNLSPSLEFVYLRDNLLSSMVGVEILKRVKVLDLSFNDFKGPSFEPLGSCKALQQLYLAGNQITTLSSIPELPNLEFLSVAQNKLKSLAMATQPRLQVLAASKNKISTFKGFPFLPVLEHLRVEENPILRMTHVEAASILLVGSTLKKFNDQDLSLKELEIAKSYPAHTPVCIRDGWEFCRPELAADSTFSFLLEKWKEHFPPGFMLSGTSVDSPFEDDICRCHFNFINVNSDADLVLKYQWLVGDRTPTNFEIIADAVGEVYWPKHEDIGKYLKVECTPILMEKVYPPVFAISSPVSPGTGYPKVLSLIVHGELIEGNLIRGAAEISWCGGTPGKGVASWLRRRWNGSPVVVVGAEDEDYLLTADDIDSSLVFMYTPVTEEGTKGEPQYAMTDFVKAASPSVSNVRILGDAVEGNTIKGIGEYFGGKEGPSKFKWMREDKETGNFVVVSSGASEYNLTKNDIGHRFAFVYIPANFEGQEGKSVSVMSEIVKKAPPKVTNLMIVGDVREGSKLTVSCTVVGGTEGSCRVQWFKTSYSMFENENSMEAISSSKLAKTFRVPLAAVGYYIVVKFTPVASDGETGESAFAISDKVVDSLPPSLNFLSVSGDYCEGEMLTATYGYIGGQEGRSLYNWYLHDTEGAAGVLIAKACGLLQCLITKDYIGKLISFECTPVRDDGIVGELRTFLAAVQVRSGSPRLLYLKIIGDGVEGTTLHAEKKYWGGEEGNSVYQWLQISPIGTVSEIKGATHASYEVSSNDIGFLVSVSCEPIRSDGTHGPTVISEHIGPIIPGPPCCQSLELFGSTTEGCRISFAVSYSGGEKGCCVHEWFRLMENGRKEKLSCDDFLDLTLEDVGRFIELAYTPVRKDGLRGSRKSVISTAISAANPKGIELVIPDCRQDMEVVPQKSYYGGKEGNGEYVWYRTRVRPDEADLVEISSFSKDFFIVGKNVSYTPTIEDVDSYLVLRWVPTRDDGHQGSYVVAVSTNPVMAEHPIVTNVRIKDMGTGTFVGGGLYYGGYEGSSMYSWYRQTTEGTNLLIPGATSINYKATDHDYNCRLVFGYTPVRSDSIVGELVMSEASNIVLPALPIVEMLYFNGKEIEGETITAVEVPPQTEDQQHVWRNYKKEIKYQWFYSTRTEEKICFELLPLQQSCSYRVRYEDIGCCLKCECFVIDVFGRSSEIASAVTSPILPGMPRIAKLEIEGRGFHTNLYAVRGTYNGGKEGKSKIQWLRSMVGSPDLISIPGEIGRMYEANVDDVGYRLVAVYTPIREDGVEGEPASASTDPIAVEPDVLREVKEKLEIGSVKFEALIDKDKKVPGAGNLERRILEVNRKRIKVVKPGSKTSFPATEIRGTYAPPFHVELFRNDQHRFKIVVDSAEEVDLMVQTRHMRDVIVLVIRGLAQRYNSTSLNSLLKVEN